MVTFVGIDSRNNMLQPMKRTRILANKNTLIDRFVSELRDVDIQHDRARFRRNLERIGEIIAYEISREYPFEERQVTTPLGIATMHEPKEEPVVATILRAGMPLHPLFLHSVALWSPSFIPSALIPHFAAFPLSPPL